MTGKVRSGYLPSLDGWRCVAILGVMLAHDTRRTVFGYSTEFYQGAGGYGVQLFFAISGLLIAWRIQQDEQKTGAFSLSNFYIRRFFRIQPPQWVYLAIVAILMGCHLVAGRWRYWFGALFLYENYLWHELDRARVVPDSYLVGHFWSLAVEEHFYLLISLFFFFVKRRRLEILGGFLLVLVLALKVGERHFYDVDVSARRTPWLISYLIFPACISMALNRPRFLQWAQDVLQPWKAFSLTCLLLVVHHAVFAKGISFRPHDLVYTDNSVLFFCFTGWVVATMLHPSSLTTRFLELRPLRFVGRISYSLYLWHLFLFGGGAAERCSIRWLTLANQWTASRYLLSFGLACLSYYLVEKPMIRLGHRLAPPATPGHQDLDGSLPLGGALSTAVEVVAH